MSLGDNRMVTSLKLLLIGINAQQSDWTICVWADTHIFINMLYFIDYVQDIFSSIYFQCCIIGWKLSCSCNIFMLFFRFVSGITNQTCRKMCNLIYSLYWRINMILIGLYFITLQMLLILEFSAARMMSLLRHAVNENALVHCY